MKALLDGVAQMIRDAGIQTANIYIGYQPPSPDSIISLYSRGGPESDSKLPYDELSIQAVVRGVNEGPMVVAQAIYDLFHGLTNTEINGVYVVSFIGSNGGPLYLSVDRNNLPEYAVNFRVEVRNVTVNRSGVA